MRRQRSPLARHRHRHRRQPPVRRPWPCAAGGPSRSWSGARPTSASPATGDGCWTGSARLAAGGRRRRRSAAAQAGAPRRRAAFPALRRRAAAPAHLRVPGPHARQAEARPPVRLDAHRLGVLQGAWPARLRAAGPGALPGELGQAPAALEVYPHAGFVTLLGGTPPPKSTRQGLRLRVLTLRRLGLQWDEYFDHDSLDALMAAFTAWRFVQGLCDRRSATAATAPSGCPSPRTSCRQRTRPSPSRPRKRRWPVWARADIPCSPPGSPRGGAIGYVMAADHLQPSDLVRSGVMLMAFPAAVTVPPPICSAGAAL